MSDEFNDYESIEEDDHVSSDGAQATGASKQIPTLKVQRLKLAYLHSFCVTYGPSFLVAIFLHLIFPSYPSWEPVNVYKGIASFIRGKVWKKLRKLSTRLARRYGWIYRPKMTNLKMIL